MNLPAVSGTGELGADLRRDGDLQGKRKALRGIALLTGAAAFEEGLRAAVSAEVLIEVMDDSRSLAEWCRAAAWGSIAVVDGFHGVPAQDVVAPDLPDLLGKSMTTRLDLTRSGAGAISLDQLPGQLRSIHPTNYGAVRGYSVCPTFIGSPCLVQVRSQ
ncbi:hypothetical protein [Longimicrobium terrae]|uniref:Uncharacterized protein n=1 Tax=Longimicrobium terrae TaxID=1639882 RepID=A0A841GWN9_9BACT|nr:hypothetical protein [Longimicrobium terrae]MBB4635918.1 hypothetical protein [Longimicrobium terrae]MBB6070314.1 hypothetical protein [Longimicrobium terrae]NNC30816.1 hypothetical protein [Longimicrobium terrae]